MNLGPDCEVSAIEQMAWSLKRMLQALVGHQVIYGPVPRIPTSGGFFVVLMSCPVSPL